MIDTRDIPLIYSFQENWSFNAYSIIKSKIINYLKKNGNCSVMLTGGRTIQSIYKIWKESDPDLLNNKNVIYFFGDERCVSHKNSESNYGTVCKILFPNGIPKGVFVHSMFNEKNDNYEMIAVSYEELLPENIDVLLLVLGEDGHIASLFPDNFNNIDQEKRVIPIIGKKPPYKRLTITPKVILEARSVLLFATGEKKGEILFKLFEQRNDFIHLPVKLTMHANATWILDQDAAMKLKERNNI